MYVVIGASAHVRLIDEPSVPHLGEHTAAN
jgi:hypothetical protein